MLFAVFITFLQHYMKSSGYLYSMFSNHSMHCIIYKYLQSVSVQLNYYYHCHRITVHQSSTHFLVGTLISVDKVVTKWRPQLYSCTHLTIIIDRESGVQEKAVMNTLFDLENEKFRTKDKVQCFNVSLGDGAAQRFSACLVQTI